MNHSMDQWSRWLKDGRRNAAGGGGYFVTTSENITYIVHSIMRYKICWMLATQFGVQVLQIITISHSSPSIYNQRTQCPVSGYYFPVVHPYFGWNPYALLFTFINCRPHTWAAVAGSSRVIGKRKGPGPSMAVTKPYRSVLSAGDTPLFGGRRRTGKGTPGFDTSDSNLCK